MAARPLYLTLPRMRSWLALLCRRRSVLIAETLTLRHKVTVLVVNLVQPTRPRPTEQSCPHWPGSCPTNYAATASSHPPPCWVGSDACSPRNGATQAGPVARTSTTSSASSSSAWHGGRVLSQCPANHDHEERCVRVLRQAGAAPHVFAATSITAELREFERTSTAVINGYVQPVIASYVERLEKALSELQLGSRLWIMQSNGGLLSARSAREQSVRTVLSGLAGGVIAAAQWARKLNLPNVVSFDIGGTSPTVIRDFEPESMTSVVIEGHHLRLPAVDVHTIGAGGGSIAWRDSGGGLRVGPQSAGASPGPSGENGTPCYVAGPYDNPRAIMRTLGRVCGQGSSDYLLPVG